MSDNSLTADEAISLLDDCEYVHNLSASGMMLGADWSRAEAIEALSTATEICLGGPRAYAMRHPIYCVQASGRRSFFSADMDKVAALEAARAVPA